MKLAEALILRADTQKSIEQLRTRLSLSAKVQEGDEPPEDPARLVGELERLSSELLSLVQRINRTNSTALLRDSTTIADALAERDVTALKRGAYATLTDAAYAPQHRYGRSEIKYFSTVNVSEMQNRIDELARAQRELDALIQAANWNINLVE